MANVVGTNPKLGAALLEELKRDPQGDLLEVVVELVPSRQAEAPAGLSRKDFFAQLEASFEKRAAPLEAAIRERGGFPLDRAWINETLRVRLSRSSIADLANQGEVLRLDLPRAIERERR